MDNNEEKINDNSFYELAWANRLKILKKIVDQNPQDSLFANFERFKRFDSTYLLNVDENRSVGLMKIHEAKEGDFPTGKPQFQWAAYSEKLFPRPYYHHPVDFLLDFLDERKFDLIVELGCGFGKNLVDLFCRGGPRNIPYYGGEYTESGVQFVQFISERAKEMNLHAFRFDHCHPDLSQVREKSNALVFTCHSIEQVERLPLVFFEKLTEHFKSLTCIHFEPFGFQIEGDDTPYGEVSQNQEFHFKQKKWNLNFASTLFEAESKGFLKIDYLKKNVFTIQSTNPTSIAIWSSQNRGQYT